MTLLAIPRRQTSPVWSWLLVLIGIVGIRETIEKAWLKIFLEVLYAREALQHSLGRNELTNPVKGRWEIPKGWPPDLACEFSEACLRADDVEPVVQMRLQRGQIRHPQ